MKLWFKILGLCFVLAGPSAAQTSPELVRSLGDAVKMDQTLAIMQREALQNADEIAEDLFGGAAPSGWTNVITELFDPAGARAQFDTGLTLATANADAGQLANAAAFYASPLGIRLLQLEISAREAMLDGEVETAAKQAWTDLLADPLPASAQRADLIEGAVAASDLIESNVSSALNGNLAFLQGLAEAGGYAAEMTADDMLREVYAQEDTVRADTAEWLYPFLALAYAPLTDAELQAYIDFAQSAAGQALNSALFLAFDGLGTVQSRGMGLAAGRLMSGQDI